MFVVFVWLFVFIF